MVHGLLLSKKLFDDSVGHVRFYKESKLLPGQGIEAKSATLIDIGTQPLHI